MIKRFKKIWDKNGPESLAILKGRFPKFVTTAQLNLPLSEVPVFVFHAVEPIYFEAQLRYLKDNNYVTLNASQLETLTKEGSAKGNEIALTFDDATWSFWAYAYPLIEKYDFQAILFAIPGLVPDTEKKYPNLRDHWEGQCELGDPQKRANDEPLCTWPELIEMHLSGYVDVQSHSLTHSRIPVSNEVIDFLHPAFDTDFYGNVNIPVSALDDPSSPSRALNLGTPVFRSLSRMTCKPMYMAEPAAIESMTKFVTDQGNEKFFYHKNWLKTLKRYFSSVKSNYKGSFESKTEAEEAVIREFSASKALLENKLEGKLVQHFCYPWFQGSTRADELARKCEYHAVHYGFNKPPQSQPLADSQDIIQFTRLSEDFLFRLPGTGRKSLSSIFWRRLTMFKARSKSNR